MWKGDVLNKRLLLRNHLQLYYHPTPSHIYTVFYSLASCLSKWLGTEKYLYFLFIGHLLFWFAYNIKTSIKSLLKIDTFRNQIILYKMQIFSKIRMSCNITLTVCVIRFSSCPKYRFVGDLNQIAYSFLIFCVFPEQIFFFSIYNEVGIVWGIIQNKKMNQT